jgi:hypothetical protein
MIEKKCELSLFQNLTFWNNLNCDAVTASSAGNIRRLSPHGNKKNKPGLNTTWRLFINDQNNGFGKKRH